jgi:hypothetical protein
MPLQLVKDGRLAEWIGKATIFSIPDHAAVTAISRPRPVRPRVAGCRMAVAATAFAQRMRG